MKNNFQNIGLAKLCSWLGMSRQAYYQNSWKAIDTTIEEVSCPKIGLHKNV